MSAIPPSIGAHLRVSELAIRRMEARDVKAAVQLHLEAFPNFFLTFLGPQFLTAFYRAFLVGETELAFVAERGTSIDGTILGTTAPATFFRRLARERWWAFFIPSVSAVCRKPAIILRLIRGLWYRGGEVRDPTRALLSSVAVRPGAQRSGVGRALLACWLGEARRRGCRGCYLTTDARDNERVNAFYRQAGWRLESTYSTPEDRLMNRYVFDFI
jgi:ribosomal protein S18 acetylase RimI-like enzyme